MGRLKKETWDAVCRYVAARVSGNYALGISQMTNEASVQQFAAEGFSVVLGARRIATEVQHDDLSESKDADRKLDVVVNSKRADKIDAAVEVKFVRKSSMVPSQWRYGIVADLMRLERLRKDMANQGQRVLLLATDVRVFHGVLGGSKGPAWAKHFFSGKKKLGTSEVECLDLPDELLTVYFQSAPKNNQHLALPATLKATRKYAAQIAGLSKLPTSMRIRGVSTAWANPIMVYAIEAQSSKKRSPFQWAKE